MDFNFTTDLLPSALGIMAKGMGGVFGVLFIIYLICLGLEKLMHD